MSRLFTSINSILFASAGILIFRINDSIKCHQVIRIIDILEKEKVEETCIKPYRNWLDSSYFNRLTTFPKN